MVGIPIYSIGAGGIVRDAHLPAYRLAGYTVAAIYDVQPDRAKTLARQFDIPLVPASLPELIQHAPPGAVFDIAVPADQLLPILRQLPEGARVLMQKPMGNNFEEAKEILQLTREKKMLAAVNFQLRYAPYIMMAKKMIADGTIGELIDVEINVNVFTPWHLWDFLFSSPRVEILYHSIHYIDLARHLLLNPIGMYARTVKHPLMPQLASVRSNIIMDYGDMVRANILTNHCHWFGLQHQQSYIKLEGTTGAIKIKMGALINYPEGVPDIFEYVILQDDEEPVWQTLPVEGSWFPHAFIGSMEQVMLAANGTIGRPDNSVEDVIHTMACVEEAYKS